MLLVDSNISGLCDIVIVVVQLLSHIRLFGTPRTAAHTRLPYPSVSPGVCSNSCALSQWCHLTISSSVTLFSPCPQSFLALGSFPMSQLFTSGGQRIGASASVLPMNIQGWFPLGLTGLISLQSKGLWRIFSSTIVQKHQLFSVQFSHLVMSDSLRPHGLQHSRPPCPPPTPGVYSNSCPLSQWCHATISSSVEPFSSCLNLSHCEGLSNELALHIRWPKYWSFSFNISLSNKYFGLISFRMD